MCTILLGGFAIGIRVFLLQANLYSSTFVPFEQLSVKCTLILTVFSQLSVKFNKALHRTRMLTRALVLALWMVVLIVGLHDTEDEKFMVGVIVLTAVCNFCYADRIYCGKISVMHLSARLSVRLSRRRPIAQQQQRGRVGSACGQRLSRASRANSTRLFLSLGHYACRLPRL